MAVAAFVVSALLVLCVSASLLVFRSYAAGAVFSIAGLLGGFWLAGMGLVLFPVGFTALGLLLICLVCLGRRPKLLQVSAIGLGVLVVAMGGGVLMSRGYIKRLGQFRETYPLASLASRLDYETKHASGPSRLSATDPSAKFGPPPLGSPAWRVLDASDDAPSHWSQRVWALRTIHASTVEQFVSAPGFGVTRISSVGEYAFENNRRPAKSLPGTTAQYPALNRSDPLRLCLRSHPRISQRGPTGSDSNCSSGRSMKAVVAIS